MREGREDRDRRTLVVSGKDEQGADALARVARNLQQVAVTHTGALDVKDVLRYERIVFTTAALQYAGGSQVMDARDVIVAPRITEKSMANALGSSTPSK